jgi:FkbM family methyltransferase
VEANPFHERDLRQLSRVLRSFRYLICCAGEAEGTAVLHVPVHHGLPLTGEASLLEIDGAHTWWVHQQRALLGHAATEGSDESWLVPVRVQRLDDLALTPSFVKVDVEGAEATALRGLSQTLADCRPVVLVEDSDARDEVRALLEGLGYHAWVYDRRADCFRPWTSQQAQNVFYLQPGDELHRPG